MTQAVVPTSAIPDYQGYFVNDWAWLLTLSEDSDLEALCSYIEEETTVEIFIITTLDLEGYDLNEFSYRVFNDWGIGKEDVNNGLLITIFYEDLNETHYAYDYRIEIGRGLEGAITDSEAGQIGRNNMTPWFNWYYFYDGLYEGIVELANEFWDDPSVRSSQGEGIFALQTWAFENPLIAGILIGVALMFAGNVFLMMSYRRGPAIIPLIAIGGLLVFAWWLDSTLVVLGISLAVALGVTVFYRGGNRFLSGGGRTAGGGWSNNLYRSKEELQ
jgi:uncharacterized membrane protein YgcG